MASYRILDKDELPASLQFSASLTDHRIVEDEHGVYRYEKNKLIDWLFQTGKVDLNAMRVAYCHGAFSREEYMQFYRDMGYSLTGFEEVFDGELDQIMQEMVKE